MLEPPANDLFAIHPASSGKRHHQPCRPFRERKHGGQTKDDIDKEPREQRSCGAFSNVVVQQRRPHSQLEWKTPSEFAITCNPRRDLALRYTEGSAPAPVATTA
jgi:hypothetical protein